MPVLGGLLFYRADRIDLDAVLRHQVELLRGKVDALPDTFIKEHSDDEVAAHVAATSAIRPLSVQFDQAKANVEEAKVDHRDPFGGSVLKVPGLVATKSIPFTGESDLWHLRPNPYTLNPPHGEIRGNNVVIGISVPTHQAEEAARYIDEAIAQIPEYLKTQSDQIARHNASLAAQAMPSIQARRQRLGSASDLLKKLGR